MAITLNTIQDSTESITLTFPDTTDTLTIWFKPEALTPKVQREAARLQRRIEVKQAAQKSADKAALEAGEPLPDDDAALDTEDRDATFSLFLTLIDRWDLLQRPRTEHEPDPPAWPVSADTFDMLGWRVLGRILDEMVESIRPNRETRRHTANGSGRRDVTVISRNGQ